MERSQEQEQLRGRFVVALIQATFPLQKSAPDREVALGLLMEAADLLKEHLQNELDELRAEQD